MWRSGGVWGWSRRTRRAAETTNAAIDAAAAAIVLNTHVGIAPGHTLLIGDEQLYVRSRVRNTLSVERGVNGTVSAPIANKSAIDIFQYPPAVSEAALLLAIRMWRGRSAAWTTGSRGDIGMDSDIGLLLGSYRKPALGVF